MSFVYELYPVLRRTQRFTETDILFDLHKHHWQTFRHSFQVAMISYAVGLHYFSDQKQAALLCAKCGLFHDIGKLGMSVDFLEYGTYTPEMREQMQKHTLGGAILLKKTGSSKELVSTAILHHNVYNDNQSEYAEIVHLSDCFAASIEVGRTYKQALTPWDAIQDIKKHESNTLFHPKIWNSFMHIQNTIIEPFLTESNYYEKLEEHFSIFSMLKDDHLFTLAGQFLKNEKK